jgi:hypothetical protein
MNRVTTPRKGRPEYVTKPHESRRYRFLNEHTERTYTLDKSRRMLEHEDFEKQNTDQHNLNGLAVGESFFDSNGNNWKRIQ